MKKEIHNSKIISHIVVLAMVVMLAVTATFSWYNRVPNEDFPTGGLLKYERSGNINGSGGTIATYVGTETNGKITYADTKVTGTISTEPGAINYFKTVITDNSTGDSLISLYLENFKTTLSSDVKVGMLKPEKTYIPLTNKGISSGYFTFNKICLIDNVPIKKDTTTEVCWFVEISTTNTTSGSIDLGTLHLVYG